jgi:malonyl CoA-acyl carrier protein transacylase
MTSFAFVFPGQGSQAIGMLNGFADNAAVRDTIAEASDALQFDLANLIAEGPKAAEYDWAAPGTEEAYKKRLDAVSAGMFGAMGIERAVASEQ